MISNSIYFQFILTTVTSARRQPQLSPVPATLQLHLLYKPMSQNPAMIRAKAILTTRRWTLRENHSMRVWMIMIDLIVSLAVLVVSMLVKYQYRVYCKQTAPFMNHWTTALVKPNIIFPSFFFVTFMPF